MISTRTKVLIVVAALPIVAALLFAVPILFSGLGIDLPVSHARGVATLLIAWIGIVASALISFRRDKSQNTNG